MVEDRKARLAALAAARAASAAPKESTQSESAETLTKGGDDTKKQINFRNYVPKDETLDKSEPPTKRKRVSDKSDGADNDPSIPKEDVKTELELALEEAKADTAVLNEASQGQVSSEPVSSVVAAPKKANWDLKRDIVKKLNRLEKRTQKAIVDLLRERLEREAEEEEGDLD
jgi:coiled-coil domain-containing protein 12